MTETPRPLTPERLAGILDTLHRFRLHDEAADLAAALQEARTERDKLREALALIEAVYRKNCVAVGEPSSVLDAVQAALAKVPEEPMTETPFLVDLTGALRTKRRKVKVSR